ncbi:MAG: RecX family transcriptional regulator [Armatimonadota bacterium]|nr:RecX family transcriptional regulator [Armatimonadota bacterium]
MPTITALEPQQRRKGRLNVFVDGQFVIGVGEGVAADLGLRVGREMTAEKLREVAGAEEVHKATENALALLDIRVRARREIETRLAQKGYEESTVAKVLENLVRLGLIDDAQFAAQWVEAKTRTGGSRPIGKRRLSQELFQKGVAKDTITDALGKVSDDDELALARAAAAKKVRQVPTDRDALRAERQKLMGFLQRRGFGWETVKQVTREALPARGEEEEEYEDAEE